jgi:predicted Zn-dependent protease
VAAAALPVVAALLVGGGPAQSSSPAAGTVDASTASVGWSGSTVAQTGGLAGGGCIVGAPGPAFDPTCDIYALTVGDLSSVAPSNDVLVAISPASTNTGIAEFDLYVYGPDGSEVGRSTELGSNDTVTLVDPAAGTYTVAVQNVLSSDVAAAYDGAASRVDAGSGPPVDDEEACGLEGAGLPPEVKAIDEDVVGAGTLVGDPTAAVDGLDRGQPISLDVLVLLDGVPQADAEAIMTTAARSYAPLNIDLQVSAYETVTFTSPDALGLITQAKDHEGGHRPAGVDVVEVLTAKDIEQLDQTAIAGLADCVGGVAHPDRAFLVAEAYTPADITIDPVPVVFDYQARANVTAHEIGHLFGGQHHYANCVEGVSASDVHGDDGFVEGTPCTLMFNAADFLGPEFDTLNGAVVRGSAVRYAQP